MWPAIEHSYIYGAARTPIGKFQGVLSSVSATDLGAVALAEAVRRSGLDPERIDEVIMGNVLSAGLGQAPARQAAIRSGLPHAVSAETVNKVCGSGLWAVMLADDLIRLREARFVAAGGMENMSWAPYYLQGARAGFKLGDRNVVDAMIHDGLWDSFGDCHMGEYAERLAESESCPREVQDEFARLSYRRAREAQDAGRFDDEIVPVPVTGRERMIRVDRDESPHAHDLDRIAHLPPAFRKNRGTVTAGNASSLSDGAAALVLGPWEESLKPLARVTAHAMVSRAPEDFPLAPVDAVIRLLDQWKLTLEEIDLFEINEAFAVSTLAVCRRLGLNSDKMNVNGGAVALGHPIGASGARILVTLLYALQARGLRRGVAAVCIGGGEAVALGVEMIPD